MLRAWRIRVLVCVGMAIMSIAASGAKAATFDWVRAAGSPTDGTITDNSATAFEFHVGAIGAVLEVEIRFSARHSFVSDLSAVLASPLGTPVTLFYQIGGTGGDFEDTYFDDDAFVSIDGESAPFAGTYRLNAGALLGAFDGEDANGVWTLTVTDHYAADEGMLVAAGQSVNWGEGTVSAAGTQLILTTVPEPACAGLTMLGLLAAAGRRRRGRRTQSRR